MYLASTGQTSTAPHRRRRTDHKTARRVECRPRCTCHRGCGTPELREHKKRLCSKAAFHYSRRIDRGRFGVRKRASMGVRRRARGPGRFASIICVFLLCLQVVAPALHSALPLDRPTVTGDLSELLGEHALCLGGTPGSSADKPSTPVPPGKDHHNDFASCCFWHRNAAQPAPDIADRVAVSFDFTRIGFPAATPSVVVPVHPFGTFSARAPPVSA